jgi:GAF domain-containing protein
MSGQTKEENYIQLISNIRGLLHGESDFIANLANTCSLIYYSLGHHWVGFYRVIKDELVLGPFHGPVACTRIEFGKGVCGKAWEQKGTIIVNDVHQFPGHIACSELSNSEIVIPIIVKEKVLAVLDLDSVEFYTFDEIDQLYLEDICRILAESYERKFVIS